MKREIIKSILIMGQEFPHLNAGQLSDSLMKLKKYESSLRRLYSLACDRNLTEAEDKRMDNIQKQVRAICDELQCKVKFNGDPRGGSICLLLNSGRCNSWDGETWRIDW